MITQKRLKELFVYDPVTGWFTNLDSRGRAAAGERAGSPQGHGYRKLTIDYVKYYEHHVAWFWVYGQWVKELDHKDGDGCNNAIANLRPATRSQNNFNSQRGGTGKSGLKGAYLDKRTLKWFSQIQLSGQVTYLGSFDTAEEAHKAFMAAVELHHGEFAFHKRNLNKEPDTWPL